MIVFDTTCHRAGFSLSGAGQREVNHSSGACTRHRAGRVVLSIPAVCVVCSPYQYCYIYRSLCLFFC